MNVVSGARISSGGLHLGHFLGCIQPLLQNQSEIDNYIFVLNVCNGFINKAELLNMLSDLYAIKSTYDLNNMHVLIDEPLLQQYSDLFSFLQTTTSLNELLHVYPQSHHDSVDDFLFPIKQAMTYYIFDAEKAFLNNDNIRFVEFASRLAKKINKSYNLKLCCPRLETGFIPRLLGFNYEKMCKCNNNSIYFSDSASEIERKIYKLFDMKQLFKKYPDELTNFNNNKPYRLPDNYLPFEFLEAFSLKHLEDIDLGFDIKNSYNRKELREYLLRMISELISPIQKVKNQMSSSFLLEQLEQDEKYVHSIARKFDLSNFEYDYISISHHFSPYNGCSLSALAK